MHKRSTSHLGLFLLWLFICVFLAILSSWALFSFIRSLFFSCFHFLFVILNIGMYSWHIPLLNVFCILKTHNNYISAFPTVVMWLLYVFREISVCLSTYRFTCSGYKEKCLFIFSFVRLTFTVCLYTGCSTYKWRRTECRVRSVRKDLASLSVTLLSRSLTL